MTKKKWISPGLQGTSRQMRWREKFKKKENPKRKSSVAFKATPSILEEDEYMDEDDEDKFAMI